MPFKVTNGRVYPIDKPNESGKAGKSNSSSQAFKHLLEKEIGRKQELKISSHALKRLDQRNLNLTAADMKNLEKAVDKAQAKGAKESLLLYKEMAFVASIGNRTIITAVGQKDTKENVFTNIDSAVIIDED